MKRTLVLGLVIVALAGCAATPAPIVTDDPVVSSPSSAPDEQGYNPPAAPDFGNDFSGTSSRGDELAAQVADAFSAAYEWPDAGPYPEVTGFYGRGSADGLFVMVVTTLTAEPDVDNPRAVEICSAVNPLWETIGSPEDWNNVQVTDSAGDFMAYCTNHATGP